MPRYKPTIRAASASASAFTGEPNRALSVDVLRGLVMLAMLFVNDIAGAKGVPAALKHFPEKGNGMTLVDVVFPALLCVVGMSIPLALESRRARGDSWGNILGHVALRTALLLVIGVLMVESPGDGRIGWPRGLWSLLMYAGVIGAFHFVRTETPTARYVTLGVRGACAGLLLFLAIRFRNHAGSSLQTKWWGVLGLIGWAYLWASLVYLLLRREGHAAFVGAVALFVGLFIADRAGAFHAARVWSVRFSGQTLTPGKWVDIGTQWGTHVAIVLSGVVVGWMLLPDNAGASPRDRIRFAGVFAATLAVGGALLYTSYGINKNAATPAWAMFSAAVAIAAWTGVYALTDVSTQNAWATPLAWAGANALLVYVLCGLWYAAVNTFGLKWYSEMGAKYPDALGRSWVLAVALSVIGAALHRVGFRLKI